MPPEKDWFKNANDPSQQVTVILDLDENIVSYGKINHRMNHQVSADFAHYGKQTFYIDRNAFSRIKQFQESGNKILIVTNADYPAVGIQEIFQQQGIVIAIEDIFNKTHREYPDQGKADFIDKKWTSDTHMLFDDMSENRPNKGVLFTQTSPTERFPELIFIHPDLVNILINIGISYDEAWNQLKENPDLQQAVVAVNATGQFDRAAWKQLKENPDLPGQVLKRNNEESMKTFRQNLTPFINEIKDLHESKRSASEAFVGNCKKADKEFLLHGSDSDQFRNAKADVKEALKPLAKHRDKGWRIAGTVLASLTVVGAIAGVAQGVIQKARGKNFEFLFMNHNTTSQKKAEKVISSAPAA
jgi:hypothetical protein